VGPSCPGLNKLLPLTDYLIAILELYSGMGMEVCTTLGMLDADQAKQLKEAGLTAYNHNLDTSREVSDTIHT